MVKKLEGDRRPTRALRVLALLACTTTDPVATEAFVVGVENHKLHYYHRHHGNIDYNHRLVCLSQSYNNEGDGDNNSRRAIGDVVKGLHGGKYLFQDAAASGGGMSFEGQQFAEMSYATSSDLEQESNYYEDEPLPNWASKLQQPISSEQVNNYPQLALNDNGKASVEIQNDERSWEKFYAFVVVSEEEDDLVLEQQQQQQLLLSQFVVEPKVGQLAPRGGTNDFSDRATINVTTGNNKIEKGRNQFFLVVGTEAETWKYRLV